MALAGMGLLSAACAAPARPVVGVDDPALDRVWLAVRRGDAAGAAEAAASVRDPDLRRRAELDALGVADGRVGAWRAAGETWQAARFDASDERARSRLSRHLRDDAGSAVLWLEWARRSPRADERRVGAWKALESSPGLLEGWLWTIEADLASQEFETADERIAELEALLPDAARVRWARRRWQWALGRRHAVAEGLILDLADGLATPSGLATLLEAVTSVVDPAAVERALEAVHAADAPGDRWRRERARVLAELSAARGAWDDAAAWLERAESSEPRDARRLEAWRAAASQQIDAHDPERVAALRLAGAWRAYATDSYWAALDGGDSRDLDAFVAHVDRAVEQIPDAPRLAWLPRTSFGVVGEMLDTSPLRVALPGCFVIGGKALGLPSDMAWYDEVAADDLTIADTDVVYRRHLVREPRVPGVLVWQGRGITGAGLHRTVFLDVDAIGRDARSRPPRSLDAPLVPAPVGGPLDVDRFDLREPLDVAARLRRAVLDDAGSLEVFEELAVDEVAVHEERHLLDADDVLAGSFADAVDLVLDVGVLPASVRPALERRAQLHALRHAREPRLALASMVDFLPVEGAGLQSEHAVGYRDVLEGFLDVLDREAWEGARPLAELGLDRDHVLVHQLPRLDVETIRAIAVAIPD